MPRALANADRPIEELLHDLGLGHRPTKEEWQSREVFDLETGDKFAIMTAVEACKYLETQGIL